jgi:serine phosphatase RsbU (regulator of sigma subunit)
MDIAVCCWNKKTNTLNFAGANNPLLIIKGTDKETIIIPPNKFPVGYVNDEMPSFTNHTVKLDKGDTIYIYSDGYQDQFGGEKGKKMKLAPFRELLTSLADKNMDNQCAVLLHEFEKWKGNFEQLDDVCIIGVRVS